MASTLIEAFELLVDAEQLAPRLDAAATALAQLTGLDHEQTWLAAARERLETARGVAAARRGLLDRALRLSELESLRGERGKLLQAAIADEVERLQAAITVAGGARSPLLEVLFLDLKVPSLRKCPRPELDKFCTDLERRLASAYAKRILASSYYQAVGANVKAFRTAVATWRNVFVEPPLEGEAAAALRDELAAAGRAVELPVRQARLLAQAALLPAAELLDGAGVLTPAGRKQAKTTTSHPLLETDPPDPLLPNADERQEIAALHGRD